MQQSIAQFPARVFDLFDTGKIINEQVLLETELGVG